MATTAPVFFVTHSEFDEFLFAPVGDEENGMTLSVMSALARLGVDPWREAARLAGLPRPQAQAALAGLFDRLPDAAVQRLDSVGHATRLIGLLPAAVAAAPRRVGRRGPPRLGLSGICLIVVLAAIGFMLVNQRFFVDDTPSRPEVSARR